MERMKMRRYFGFLLLAAFFAGWSCSKKSKTSAVVAEVGDEKITVEDVTGPLSLMGRLFASPEEELAEKQRILDSIIEARLLLREAYQQKLDQDTFIRAFEELERPLFLIDALYFREVRDKVRLTKSEVKRYYRALQQDRCFRQILTADRAQVDSLLALVHKGARFDSLAQALSKDPISAPRGGELGCYGWKRRFPNDLFEKTLSAKPGDVLGPLRVPEGWILLECYEERPALLPDLAVFEPELRLLLESLRAGPRSAELAAEVRRSLGFRVVDSAARLVNFKQLELSKVTIPEQPERYSVYLRTEALSSAERNMTLLTYRGGKVAVGQYLERLQGSMPSQRLVLDTSEATRAVLFQLIFRDAMANRALELGLDKDREFLKRFRQAVESQMAHLLKTRLLSSVRLDSSGVRTYFETHSEEFVQPAAVRLFEINRPDEGSLLKLKKSIRSKSEFLATASRFTTRAQLRPAKGELGWVEQHQFPELFAAAAKLKRGGMAGPVALGDGSFSLIYLEERRPERKQSFREVQDDLAQRIWARALDSTFSAWMEGQKKKVKVAVYPEVLEKTIDRTYYAKLLEWQEKLKKGAG
jgi:parvulin-like peptidyl-prolyl isomerase